MILFLCLGVFHGRFVELLDACDEVEVRLFLDHRYPAQQSKLMLIDFIQRECYTA